MKECHVKFYQSQRRISYIHLCKNTKVAYLDKEGSYINSKEVV